MFSNRELNKRGAGNNPKDLDNPCNEIRFTSLKSKSLNNEDLKIFQNEWKTVIETQMHFNDLIIKFRTIVLTTFTTLSGIIITLSRNKQIEVTGYQPKFILCIPIIFLFFAFILDFFYYHQLLLGAVTQARKFDNNEIFQKHGLFGLTTCISNRISEKRANVLICIFYLLPAILLILFIVLY